MNYKIERAFEKDFSKLKNKKLANSILAIMENVSNAATIEDIKNIKKMTGSVNAYRIRSGNYRIGVYFEENNFVFTAFDHRKNIYKRFP